jgi:hypothetical protein
MRRYFVFFKIRFDVEGPESGWWFSHAVDDEATAIQDAHNFKESLHCVDAAAIDLDTEEIWRN